MSLINEALKRAKESQQPATASVAPGPQLLPVERCEAPRSRAFWQAPLTLMVVAGLAVILGIQFIQLHVRGRSATPAATVDPQASPGRVVAQASVNNQVSQPAPTRVAAAQPAPAAVRPTSPEVRPSNPSGILPARSVPDTQPAAAAAAPPVAAKNAGQTAVGRAKTSPAAETKTQGEPMKLQAIVYSPTRPSALISGRTVFVGDDLGPYKVTTITQTSVTVSRNGQSWRLSLNR